MKRLYYLDILRTLACFFVIVNHTNSMIFLHTTPSPLWFTSILYLLISKIAVPLFVMITGALMLQREDSWMKIFIKELRVVIVMLLLSILYFFVYGGKFTGFNSVKTMVLNFLQNGISGSFWYLYLYMGILLMMPFLQKLRKGLSDTDYWIIIFVPLLLRGILPILNHFFPFTSTVVIPHLPIFDVYIALLFAGNFIATHATRTRISYIAFSCFIVSMIVNLILTYVEYNKLEGTGERYLFFSDRELITTTISSISVFYIIKHLFSSQWFSEKTAFILQQVSACTFGIYLIADALIQFYRFIYIDYKSILTPLFSMLTYEIIIFISALVIIYVLRKLPFFKSIL